MSIVERELSELYDDADAFAARPLPVQYADFALSERDRLQGDVLETELHWWRQHLAGKSLDAQKLIYGSVKLRDRTDKDTRLPAKSLWRPFDVKGAHTRRAFVDADIAPVPNQMNFV